MEKEITQKHLQIINQLALQVLINLTEQEIFNEDSEIFEDLKSITKLCQLPETISDYDSSTNKVREAKETLKKGGYFVDNLWSVEDVQDIFNCSNEEAQDVLNIALTNEGTMHHIWTAIRIAGEDKSLKEN